MQTQPPSRLVTAWPHEKALRRGGRAWQAGVAQDGEPSMAGRRGAGQTAEHGGQALRRTESRAWQAGVAQGRELSRAGRHVVRQKVGLLSTAREKNLSTAAPPINPMRGRQAHVLSASGYNCHCTPSNEHLQRLVGSSRTAALLGKHQSGGHAWDHSHCACMPVSASLCRSASPPWLAQNMQTHPQAAPQLPQEGCVGGLASVQGASHAPLPS